MRRAGPDDYWLGLRAKFTDEKQRMDRLSAMDPLSVDAYLAQLDRESGPDQEDPDERTRRLDRARREKARQDAAQRHRELSLDLNLRQAVSIVREAEGLQREALARMRFGADARQVLLLLGLSLILFVLSYHATAHVFEQISVGRLTPADAAQVVTAVGGAPAAVVLGIYGVLKGTALVMHAWADVVRARAGLPPAASAEDGGQPGGGAGAGAGPGA
ncbi:hypothetical protein ACFWUW_14450 [Streptomyces sp. NPDC058655]|uniref:hypothetical protein n=1 Tax=Streptomyces sp. NPDC058655 TaxID=3346577 RepID=UPI003665E354